VTRKQSRKRWLLAIAAIVAILFLARPGANRLKSRVVNTMSMALGRQVDVGALRIHVLPRPGFDLEKVVVHDDPAISAEPMLQAAEVTASLRLRSLLRGRLEISRLSLSEPSVNLTRTGDGRWSLEGLVERAAKSPIAPTSKSAGEPRPGFPYIEASRARVNIKLGQEKKAFALTDADLAVWQESENSWGMRLRAQPIRTDFNLTDTGLVRLDGTWQRAATLQETPVDFHFQWQEAQLGALTKLLLARDAGWRGGVDFSANFKGQPSSLEITSMAKVGDFRRYDLLGGGNLNLATECGAHFDSRLSEFSNIDCHSPVGEGTVRVAGNVREPLGSRTYGLTLTVEKVPAQALATLVRRAKKGLPEGLAATGYIDGTFTAQKSADKSVVYGGSGQAVSVTLGDSASDSAAFELGTIVFAVGEAQGSDAKRRKQTQPAPSTELQLTLLPFPLSLGRPTPALAQGTLLRHGYQFKIEGESQVQRVFDLARLLGISAYHPAVDGNVKLDVHMEGQWTGFAAPHAEGSAVIRSMRVELRGTSAPVEISAGQVTLDADTVRLEKLSAAAAGTNWSGQITLPRSCEGKQECFGRYGLAADKVSTEELGKFFTPASGKRAWYRLLAGAESNSQSPFLFWRASGSLRIGQLLLHQLIANKVQSTVEINRGTLRFSDMHAQVLSGTYKGNWTVDFGVRPPAYSGDGEFDKISLEQLTTLLGGPWATGTGHGTMKVKASGYSLPSLRESAEGALSFDIHNGRFGTLRLRESGEPVMVEAFTGELLRREGKFEIKDGKLQMPDSIYQVSGTISSGNKLDLKLARTGGGYIVNGTLIEPRAVPDKSASTQAALKP
jgi:AsmA-like protein